MEILNQMKQDLKFLGLGNQQIDLWLIASETPERLQTSVSPNYCFDTGTCVNDTLE